MNGVAVNPFTIDLQFESMFFISNLARVCRGTKGRVVKGREEE